MSPRVYAVDPLADPRWPALLARHFQASIFHTLEWLRALQCTYGYQPVAFTTSPPAQELEDGWVFCRVKSALTGSRLVSLPFSDHLQPLAQQGEGLAGLLPEIEEVAGKKWQYLEVRPLSSEGLGLSRSRYLIKAADYCFHKLDLQPSLEALFAGFHKSCVQRKIQRAEREGLAYDAGCSESLLAKFYSLQQLTRRRHHLPPQPTAWFRNLIGCMGDGLTLRLASKDGQPVAAILTLRYKNTMVYKYGCSDARFHNLGGMPLLFWKAIQEAKTQGVVEFDLGRSDLDNPGLIAFKDHLGAASSALAYYRSSARGGAMVAPVWARHLTRRAVDWLPDPVLRLASNLLYKHVG